MKKRIYHFNRPGVPDQEIERIKNFESLMQHYTLHQNQLKKLNVRNIVITSFIGVSLVILILLVYFSIPQKNEVLSDPESSVTKSFIDPPVKTWDIPYVTALIAVDKDTTLVLSSGSSVKFPKNCLENAKGKKIDSGIEVRIREFPTPAEIFLAGIPMIYDSAGVKTVFETAGMIEIHAFHQDRPLKIRTGYNVEVSVVSPSKETDYNLYYLDTVSQNWVYKGKDKVNIVSEKMQVLRRLNRSKPVEKEELIVSDSKVNEARKKEYLSINFLDYEFPELKSFKNTLFEVDTTFASIKKEHAAIGWEDVVIRKGPHPATYYLTFFAGNDSGVYRVKTVLPNSEGMQKRNDSLYREYQNTLAIKREREKRGMDAALAADSAYTRWSHTQAMILRSFTIQNFGIWNVDKIRVVQNAKVLVPVLTLDDWEYHQLYYFADASRRSLTFHYSPQVITCDAKSKNMIWTITVDNKVAVIPSGEISKLKGGYEKQVLKLRRLKTQVNTASDFIKLYKNDFEAELD